MDSKALLPLVVCAATLSGQLAGAQACPAGALHFQSRWLVRWKANATKSLSSAPVDVVHFHRAPAGRAGLRPQTAPEPRPLEILQLTPAQAQRLQSDPAVEVIEPDCLFPRAQLVPQAVDPRRGELWGLDRINIEEGWLLTEGNPSVVISVNDSGVDYLHEDLSANMWINPSEIPGNGVDDDSNGCVDDITGCDNHGGHGNTLVGARQYNHGTHVAGTVAAVKGNNRGVIGVAPRVRIMDSISFPTSGGLGAPLRSTMIKSVAYSVRMGARVINASWATQSTMTLTEREALDFAASQGVILVVAAGNDGELVTDQFPMSHPKVIAVAATGPADQLAPFSNFGPNVIIAAPGGMGAGGNGQQVSPILSTLPQNGYGVMSGTSMAAPHVAGLIGLMLSLNPTLQLEQIRDLLKRGADEIDVIPAFHPDLGQRMWRVNAGRTLRLVKSEYPYVDPNPRPSTTTTTASGPPSTGPVCVGEACKADESVVGARGAAEPPRWVSGCGGRARDHAEASSVLIAVLIPIGLWISLRRKR